MHPLSIFPQLLFLGMMSPFLLRLCVGILIIYLGNKRYSKVYGWSSGLYFISGLLIVLGLYTQIAVILGALVLVFDFYLERKAFTTDKKILFVISGVILLSLLFTGPGFFAFDLPL